MDAETLHDRWHRAARWLDASAAELAGLVVLLVGALAVVGVLWWTGRPVAVPSDDAMPGPTDPSAAPPGLVGADEVTVHVAGAVGRPGLVRLPVGARVADAVRLAGGLVLDADPGALNLARPVVDGERLDVPRLGDVEPGAVGPGAAAGDTGGAQREDGTLDLNLATLTELQELPGVGPVLAQRILDWRDDNGPFTEVGQLREVAGIGEARFQELADRVAV